MSLLSLCQNACRDTGFAVPSTIVGSTNETAIQLLALANRAGKLLAKKPWQAIQSEYTFSTVASTATYALPSDYGWFINDTAWDRTDYWRLRNSLSPQAWQEYKSGINASVPRSRWRIRNNLIYVDPTPSSTLSMVVEYVSNAWVTDGVSTFTQFSTDAQTSRIPEELIELEVVWRFLKRKGLDYAEELLDAQKQIELALAHDTPSNATNQAGFNAIWPPLPTVPVTGYS